MILLLRRPNGLHVDSVCGTLCALNNGLYASKSKVTSEFSMKRKKKHIFSILILYRSKVLLMNTVGQQYIYLFARHKIILILQCSLLTEEKCSFFLYCSFGLNMYNSSS